MSDIVNREDVLDTVRQHCTDEYGLISFDSLDLLDKLEGLPSAQIRCKDCKWFNELGCAIRIVDDTDRPNEDDFCSFAERRTE